MINNKDILNRINLDLAAKFVNFQSANFTDLINSWFTKSKGKLISQGELNKLGQIATGKAQEQLQIYKQKTYPIKKVQDPNAKTNN